MLKLKVKCVETLKIIFKIQVITNLFSFYLTVTAIPVL